VTLYTEGFSHFVTSMTAPVASGGSKNRRAGFAPAGKAPPFHGARRTQVVTAGTNTGTAKDWQTVLNQHDICRQSKG
jgi:hypothetical protein